MFNVVHEHRSCCSAECMGHAEGSGPAGPPRFIVPGMTACWWWWWRMGDSGASRTSPPAWAQWFSCSERSSPWASTYCDGSAISEHELPHTHMHAYITTVFLSALAIGSYARCQELISHLLQSNSFSSCCTNWLKWMLKCILNFSIARRESAFERRFPPSGQGPGLGLGPLQLCLSVNLFYLLWPVVKKQCEWVGRFALTAIKVHPGDKLFQDKDQVGRSYISAF